ncbi:hypothetical protein LUZ60_005513 [Juncus effusus]|nr:hypothetical protein LUZ60_005513 [Juncus effusus]
MKSLVLPEHFLSEGGLLSENVVQLPNLANAVQLENVIFQVGGGPEGHTIGVLKHINGMYEKLAICNLDKVSSKREAEEAKLNNMEFINCLILCWSHTETTNIDTHEEVLEGLCPHPNLKSLTIWGYEGESLNPSWLETLTNLTTIDFDLCCNITTITCIPPSITTLKFSGCWELISLQDSLVASK